MLAELKLPNGSKFTFKYNPYGEVERINYPTGGYERFAYQTVAALIRNDNASAAMNRGVADRWVGSSVGSPEMHWHYSASWSNGVYSITTTNPDGTKEERDLYGGTADNPYGYSNPLVGMTKDTRVFDSNGALRSRSLMVWTTESTPAPDSIVARDPRVAKVYSIICDPAATSTLATLSETIYDITGNPDIKYFSALNPKQAKNYGFVTVAESSVRTFDYSNLLTRLETAFGSQTPVATSQTDYLYDANYQARGITS